MKKRLLAFLCAALALFANAAAAQDFTGYRVKRVTTKTLCEGAVYTQYALTPESGAAGMSQRLFVVDVDFSLNPRLTLQTAVSGGLVHGSKKRVTEYAAQEKSAGARVIAAVNGDFFDTASGGPLGYAMRDGVWLAAGEFKDSWAAGFTSDGRAVIGQPRVTFSFSAYRDGQALMEDEKIDALNAARADLPAGKSAPQNALCARLDNALVLYTQAWDTSTGAQDGGAEALLAADGDIRLGESVLCKVERVNGPSAVTEKGTLKIPQGMALEKGKMVLSGTGAGALFLETLQPGDTVEIACAGDPAFDGAVTVAGGGRPDGGPLLVQNGQKTTPDVSLADDYTYFYARHPRTVFGLRADGTCFFLVIEGNRSGSYGMTIEQAQQAALDLGAEKALNLDGGPSSTMVVLSGKKVRLVTDTTGGSGRETPVGSALLLIEKEAP